jgi:O-antigen/teichoic acid export membrane protein
MFFFNIKNKLYKKFFLNSFLSSLPGFISILLSILSIPIYLNYGGAEEYGNYIFLHFLSFIAPVLNFGLGKIAAITISQNRDKDATALVVLLKTIKNSLLTLLILFLFFISNEFFLFISRNIFFLATLSIVFTTLFITIEGIFQGKKLFFGLMIINLFFYGISLSLPPFLLIYQHIDYKNIFFISLIIKAIIIIISILYLFKNKPLKFFCKYSLPFSYHPNQKWFSISSLLNIAYDIVDKYLVKIYIGSVALAVYSIPQQLTGKLSIISKGISAVLLPSIAIKKKKLITKDFLISLRIFIFFIPLLIFLLFNFFSFFFDIWLGKNSSIEIINLAKIFSIVTWVSCLSHLIISYYEGSGTIKINSTIELVFFPIFFTCLYFATVNKNLFIISIVILMKEIILFIFRSIQLSKKIKIIKYSYLVILISLFFLFYSININFYKF